MIRKTINRPRITFALGRRRAHFATVVAQYQHNVSAYKTVGSRSVAAALRVFLASDRDEVIALAQKDLRPFLSESAWQRYWPQGIAEMVDYTRQVLARIADAIEAPGSVDEDALDLKRPPGA